MSSLMGLEMFCYPFGYKYIVPNGTEGKKRVFLYSPELIRQDFIIFFPLRPPRLCGEIF